MSGLEAVEGDSGVTKFFKFISRIIVEAWFVAVPMALTMWCKPMLLLTIVSNPEGMVEGMAYLVPNLIKAFKEDPAKGLGQLVGFYVGGKIMHGMMKKTMPGPVNKLQQLVYRAFGLELAAAGVFKAVILPKLTGGRVGKGGGYWTIWEDEHRAIGKPLNYTAEEIDFLNRNPNTENYQMKIAPPESAEFRALDAEGRQAHLRSIFTDPADMPTGGLEAHQNQIDMQRAALIGAEESIENIGRWATIAKAFKSGGLNVVNLGVGGLGGLAGVGLINAIDPTNSIPTELRQTLTGAAGGVGSEVFLSRLRGIKLATNLRNLGAASGVGAVAMGGGLAVEEAVHALLDFIPDADEGAKFVVSQTAGGAASGALFGSQAVQQASMKAAQLLGQVASPAIRVAAQAVAPLAEGIGSAAGTVGSAITEGVAGASSAISSALGTTATAAGEAIVGTELTAVGAGIAETAGLSSAVGVAGETALGATGIIDALGAVETTAATIGEFAGMAEAGALTAEAGLVGAGEIGAIAGAELAGAELAGVAGAVGGELAAGEIGALAAGEVAAMALGETAAIEAGVVARSPRGADGRTGCAGDRSSGPERRRGRGNQGLSR